MLYTGKGDDGTTKSFNSKDRFSKASVLGEALGSLDELNSFLGFVKVRTREVGDVDVGERQVSQILFDVQKNLFIVQAEVAGAEKTIDEGKVREVEAHIAVIEETLPPITSFIIPGGGEVSALLDVARTIVRRTERRVVEVHEEGSGVVGKYSLAYMNRLSSLMYALARRVNHASGITEESPDYK